MTTQNLALFKGLTAKMGYLNHRQSVISQNIANADTPGYVPNDLTKPDFGAVLERVDTAKRSGMAGVSMAATESGHMRPGGERMDLEADEARATYEVAPAGNAVIIEEQLINAQKTMMDYNLMTSLYQKNVGLIKTALGTR